MHNKRSQLDKPSVLLQASRWNVPLLLYRYWIEGTDIFEGRENESSILSISV